MTVQPKECNSQIYCQGELLKRIQMSSVFVDSKTFVDMPGRKSEREVSIFPEASEVNYANFYPKDSCRICQA
jgi:hypothetical protein